MNSGVRTKELEVKERQLWNEYQMLREEIKSADALNYQILGVVVAASVAILTAGFKEAQLLTRLCIFVSVYAVTFSAYRLLCGNRVRIWRISTYMRKFLEPELKYLNWETRVSVQREKVVEQRAKDTLSSLIGKNEWVIIFLLNSSALISAVISYFTSHKADSTPVEIGILVIMLLLFGWLVFYTSAQGKSLKRGGVTEQNFQRYWFEVEKDEAKRKLKEAKE